jgi:hypothetical protein
MNVKPNVHMMNNGGRHILDVFQQVEPVTLVHNVPWTEPTTVAPAPKSSANRNASYAAREVATASEPLRHSDAKLHSIIAMPPFKPSRCPSRESTDRRRYP